MIREQAEPASRKAPLLKPQRSWFHYNSASQTGVATELEGPVDTFGAAHWPQGPVDTFGAADWPQP